MYEAGSLWGSWSDKAQKDFYGGKPVVINADATWSVAKTKGGGKILWDKGSRIDLKDKWNSHFVDFINATHIDLHREDGKKWTLVKEFNSTAQQNVSGNVVKNATIAGGVN